jgi:hypothetical protein
MCQPDKGSSKSSLTLFSCSSHIASGGTSKKQFENDIQLLCMMLDDILWYQKISCISSCAQSLGTFNIFIIKNIKKNKE